MKTNINATLEVWLTPLEVHAIFMAISESESNYESDAQKRVNAFKDRLKQFDDMMTNQLLQDLEDHREAQNVS